MQLVCAALETFERETGESAPFLPALTEHPNTRIDSEETHLPPGYSFVDPWGRPINYEQSPGEYYLTVSDESQPEIKCSGTIPRRKNSPACDCRVSS